MRLLKSTAIIGSLTLVSRLMGLVRDVLIARFLGAGLVSDAFFTAFKLPNVFRRMFAEGAFNAAFIPLYARRIEEEGEAAADAFASEVGSMLFIVVLTLVILFEITMPWSLNIIGYGLSRSPDELGIVSYDLAVLYAMVTMPYLLFMSMMALFSGVMNTRERFAVPTLALALVNVFMITALVILPRFGLEQKHIGLGLSGAVMLSGIAQAGLVFWGCKRIGVRFYLRRPRLTPGVKRLFILGVPGLISAGITQINLLVSHSIATMQKGAASWLTYADRLYQLPLGMIGIAMGVALLPALSRRLRAGDQTGARTTLNRAIEIAAFLTLPAAFALATIPQFLISGLFERGAFTAETTEQVALALGMFAYGLPAFVMLKILTPAFFAREDTKTPMIYAGLSAFINVTLGVYLFFAIGFYGLALATSVAAWVNVVCLTWLLLKDQSFTPDTRLLSRLPRIVLASAAMAVSLIVIAAPASNYLSGNFVKDFIVLGGVCGLGFVIYAAAAALLRAFNMSDIRDALKRS